MSLFGQTRFSVRYDDKVPLTGVKFRVIEWSINVGKSSFINEGAELTKNFRDAFVKARKGTKVYFDYVIIIPPDGVARKVKLDQTYIKKAKRNEKYDLDERGMPWLHPQSGG